MEHVVMVPTERYMEMKCAEEKLKMLAEELAYVRGELSGLKALADIAAKINDKEAPINDEDLPVVHFTNEEIACALHLCAANDEMCDGCPFIECPDCADKLMEAAANALDEFLES